MASLNNNKNKKQLLILMKGHPGTGKSTLSRSIASKLNAPLLDKDDIRDSTFTLQHHHTLDPSLLNTLSHDILVNLAKTQLHLGLNLVIDSTLSRKPQFDRMVEAASEVAAKVFVIECRPLDEGEWRRRVEQRRDERSCWHKPCTWREMERLICGYDGCFEYDVAGVPKLVVDTTSGDKVEDVVSRVIEFIVNNDGVV